jgi:NADH-quinone oxidoreductase subunit G
MPAPEAASPPAAAPAVEMVNVQIDGVWHRFPKGTRLIEACRQVAREVPHYCYHPKLTSPGNCRMCLVEMGMPARPAPGQQPVLDEHGMPQISWSPRPIIACANTVAEGMGVRTDSVLTQEVRRGVMEFLLINHPLDCPICDQAGECRLQEFSVEHGQGQSRFREEKVKKPKNVDIGPRVRLDDERCIMCSRCIRFTAEIADAPVLGFTERGSHTTLAVHPGKRLEHNYSLNTVDICPVGALTSTDFRFQQRVWFLSNTKSICTGCARGCNMEIGARGDRILRQTPRENNAVNSTWMCDEGRLDFHFVNSELRLTQPLGRRSSGSGHEPLRWEQALQRAAELIKSHRAEEIGIVASARMTNEELFAVKTLAAHLGVSQVAVVPRTGGGDDYLRADDLNPNSAGAREILGASCLTALPALVDSVKQGRVRLLLALGENLLKAGFSDADLGKTQLISLHVLANACAEFSEVVLAGSTYAEKNGSMINETGRLQRLNRAVRVPGSARDSWEILRDLLRACGGELAASSVAQLFTQMASEIACLAGQSLEAIGEGGVQVLDTGVKVPLLEREAKRKAQGLIVG